MKILLDTNILILREDNSELRKDLRKLMQLIQKENYAIYVHPDSAIDIKKDSNERRKKVMLSKFGSYPKLEDPPDYVEDRTFKEKIPGFKNLSPNSLIDLRLFYSLYRNAVSFLVTEDRKIHKWARIFNIECCYNVSEALEAFREPPEKKQRTPLPIQLTNFSKLILEDPLFRSLKKDYRGFKNWFRKKAQEGRKAYVCFNEDRSLGAFLSLKEEKNEWINSKPQPIHKKKIIKISTLKVANIGNKIGELFLNIAFRHAMKKRTDELYLTYFIKENDRLVDLIEEFGFVKSENHIKHDRPPEREAIFFKKLCTDETVSAEKLRCRYFPSFYDGESTRKFIVPIKPDWHDRLFQDQRKQQFLHEYDGEFCVEGNTIKKVYICRSNCRQIRKGDILLFYHSTNNQRISVLGTVDQIEYNMTSPERVQEMVHKRTVYTFNEIKELTQKKPVTVILFKYHFPLEQQIPLKDLERKGILKRPPQSISQLEHKKYLKLKRESKIPEKFTHWNLNANEK